ncbi:MAG: DNA/RNA nuclease SfsA, partial [Gammaproteobacteria bacterium]|nr:DNA/RNA nuclease SfsA [Gammaproteobacteria bacterium]
TGSMLGCSQPGLKVWVQNTFNSNRKYPYSWELVQTNNNILVGINTLLSNKLVREGIEINKIPEIQNYDAIKTEVRYGKENSRIDLLLKSNTQPDCFVEVKNVTMVENKIAYFPDAVSQRGLKHLRELIDNVNCGNRSIIFFCIQRNDATSFSPAHQIHPEYAKLLKEAANSGVETLAYTCNLTTTKLEIKSPVPVRF